MDLRKSYSEDDLPTALWRFPLSFIPFLVLYVFLSKVRISPKVTIACNGFCLLRHTKIWLAHDIISYSGTSVLACTLLHRKLRDYSLGQITFAVFRALLNFGFNSATKSKETRNKILGRENILA